MFQGAVANIINSNKIVDYDIVTKLTKLTKLIKLYTEEGEKKL